MLLFYYVLTFFYGVLLRGIGRMDLISNESAGLYLTVFIIFFLYYFLTELGFKGRTIGKFVTGTKAVNEDGSDLNAKTALLRTLCRFVPFEPLSALFGERMWHDKWVHTCVIDVKKTEVNSLPV